MKKQIDVVGAVIVQAGTVLCAQRGPAGHLPGLWEFPGGKVDSGEIPRDALEREVEEELRCMIEVGEELTTTNHEYDFGIVTLTTYFCTLLTGTPQLTEHAEVLWLPPTRLLDLNWAPADVPAVQILSRVNVSSWPSAHQHHA